MDAGGKVIPKPPSPREVSKKAAAFFDGGSSLRANKDCTRTAFRNCTGAAVSDVFSICSAVCAQGFDFIENINSFGRKFGLVFLTKRMNVVIKLFKFVIGELIEIR